MIEVNEVEPVEPSLTVVLRGDDVDWFKALMECNQVNSFIAKRIWEAINS